MRGPRLWLVSLFLILLAGVLWMLDSGNLASTAEWTRESDNPMPRALTGSAARVDAKPIEGPLDQAGDRASGGGRRALVDEGAFGIEGKVVDVLGRGLAEVLVSACSLNTLRSAGASASKLGSARSGEGGVFRIEGVRGSRLFLLAETAVGNFGTVFVDRSPVAGWVRELKIVVLEGEVVRGRVVDAQGQPIEAAWIRPAPLRDGRFRYWGAREVRSDAEGRFDLRGLPPGETFVSVWARGFRLGLRSVDSRRSAAESESENESEKERLEDNLDIEVKLLRGQGIVLRGRIEVDKVVLARLLAQQPRVRLGKIEQAGKRWPLPSPFGGFRFDQDGSCEISGLVPGRVTAILLGLDMEVAPRRLHRDLLEGQDAAELIWRPSPLLPLEAQLLGDGGRALAGIELGYFSASRSRSARSDEQGRIRLEAFAVKGDRCRVELQTPGWYFELEQSPKFANATSLSAGVGQTLRLRRGPNLAGRVLAADGRPAKGAAVLLLPEDARNLDVEVRGMARSDADGRFLMTPDWPERPIRVRLGASLGRHLAVYPEVLRLHESTRLTGLTLHLRPGAIVEGQLLLADGRPAAAQTLSLVPVATTWFYLRDMREGDALSDAEGRFRFLGAPPGTWRLTIPLGNLFFDQDPITVELEIGTKRDLGTILVRRGLAIAGKFLDIAGKPHAQPILVTASRTKAMSSPSLQRLSKSAMATSDGSFRVEGLSAGSYELQFRWQPTSTWSLPTAPAGSFPGLDRIEPYRTSAAAGQTDLEYRVAKPGFGDLEIRIWPDGDGWTPARLHLALQNPELLFQAGAQRMAVKAGLVSVSGIRAGRYRLRLRHPRFGRMDSEVLIRGGQRSHAELDLGRLSRRIDIRVSDEQGHAISGASVGLLPLIDNEIELDDPWGVYWPPSRVFEGELNSDARGQGRLLAAPVGESLLMAWKPGFVPFARRIQGGEGLIEATLRRGAELRLQISKQTLGATGPDAPWSMRLRCLESATTDRDPRLGKGVTFALYGSRPHSLTALPPGRYLVEGFRPAAEGAKPGLPERAVHREFRLQAGQPRQLNL